MWPMILSISRDECKRFLRRLELEAYASLVSALRAQGELCSEKLKLLKDIAATLNISMERHRAEIRRAVNDEKLATIAEHIAGPNTEINWAIEGRRVMPLMPRLVPQTAFTALANNVANIAAAENAKLPPPAETVKLSAQFGNKLASADCEPNVPEGLVAPRRPTSPSEMAFSSQSPVMTQVKNSEEPETSRKRRRSSCEKTDPLSSPQTHPPPAKIPAIAQSPASTSPQPKLPLDPVLTRGCHAQQEQPSQQKHQQPAVLLQSPTHQQSRPQQQSQSSVAQTQQQQQQKQQVQTVPQVQPPQSPSTPLQQLQQQRQQQEQQQLQQLEEQHQQQQGQHQQEHQQQLPSHPQQQRIPKLQHPSQQSATPKTESYTASIPPVKITLTAASSRVPVTTVTTSAIVTPPSTQKVIIMSSSGAPGSPSILQRSLSVPVVKTVSACGSPNASQRSSSLILSGQSHCRGPLSPPGSSAMGNIVTISTNSSNTATLPSSGSAGGASTTTFIAQSTTSKLRTKSVQLPARIRTRPAGSIIIPMTPNQVSSTNTIQASNNVQSTQLKPAAQAIKPCVTIKPDNGLKMVPMSNIGSNTKILPKPVFSSSTHSPVYVMTSATGGSLVTRTTSSSTVSRMVTINTTATSHSNSSVPDVRTAPTTVITKNVSKPLQTVHISAQSGGVSKAVGAKPNVILVQKPSSSALSRSITLPHAGKEILGKVLVGKAGIPAGGHSSVLSLMKSSHISHPGNQQSGNLSTTTTHGNVIVLDLSQEQLSKNSTLSDILRVSGILPDDSSSPENTPSETTAGENLVQQAGSIENAEVHMSSTDSEKQFEEVSAAPNESSSTLHTLEDHETIVHAYSEDVAISRRQDEETVEMVGELDPQTGIYSIHPSHPSAKGSRGCSATSVQSSESTIPKSNPKTMDIFSTAIASADIDLETFNYNEGEKVVLEEVSDMECSTQYSKTNNNNNITVETLAAQGDCTFITTQNSQDHDFRNFLHENGSTTVASVFVEPTHMDTSEMHIEDFASQKIQAHEVA